MQRRHRRRGRTVAPERLDQAVRGDDATGVQPENRKRRALLAPTEPDGVSGAKSLYGAQEPYLDMSHRRDRNALH